MLLYVPNLFTICHFSAGERILTYQQMQPIAARVDDTILVNHVERGLAHDRFTHDLDVRWLGSIQHNVLYGGDTKNAKHEIDRSFTSIRDVALVHLKDMRDDDRQKVTLQQFLADVFPAGVGAVTSMKYADQAATTERALAKLQGPYAPLMAELGLSRKVAQLTEASARLGQGLRERQSQVDFKEVRAARQRGHEILLEIVAIILGRYFDGENPEHVATRTELLMPVIVQDELIRGRRRARRANGSEAAGAEEPLPGEEDEDPAGEGEGRAPAEDSNASTEPVPPGTPAPASSPKK